VYDLQSYWREVGGNFSTIPQYFKEHGYTSVGMGKIFHPGSSSGRDDPLSWSTEYYKPWTNGHYSAKNNSWRSVPLEESLLLPLPDQDITREAIDRLGQFSRSQEPFFMAVGYYKPHLPFVYPEEFHRVYNYNEITEANNTFAPINYPELAWSLQGEMRSFGDIAGMIPPPTGEMGTKLPEWKSRQLRKAYYTCVTYIDALIGELLEQLEQLGLAENTIVTLVSDHGFLLGEHALWGKHVNLEEATKVPLMVKVPGLTDATPGGVASKQLTELVDVFPTLVDAAGLPQISQCIIPQSPELTCTEGSSLLPLVTDGDDAPWKQAVFSQKRYGARMGFSVRTSRFRYTEIVRLRDNWPSWEEVFAYELYDYEVDPAGDVNLAWQEEYLLDQALLKEMLMDGWMGAIPNAITE